MRFPRLQLFEFNDHPLAPLALRETIVEALSRALDWGHVLQGLADPFAAFLAQAGSSEVLDLCAGAGGPAEILASEFRRSGRKPPKFLLTDLHPHPEVWAAMKRKDPEAIDFIPESVDATAIPPGLGHGRVRMIINALHHLPPQVAGDVLRGACADAPGVFVSEAFERHPLGVLPIFPMALPALLYTPIASPRRRLTKLAILPLSFAAGTWDGFVSTMRVYSEEELRAMVAPVGDGFEWSYGTYPFGWGGVAYWFAGVRKR
jgi:hypothetical protein